MNECSTRQTDFNSAFIITIIMWVSLVCNWDTKYFDKYLLIFKHAKAIDNFLRKKMKCLTNKLYFLTIILSYLSLKCINYELKSDWIHTFYTFLNYMISILIFHTFQNMAIKLFHNFFLQSNELNINI